MLHLQHLKKSYGVHPVLADVSGVINNGEHVGLIGPNGVGKSTLLRCLIGAEQPDAGVIVRVPSDLVLGYLPQALDLPDALTVGAAVAAAQADFVAAEAALQRASEALATSPDFAAASAAYDDALAHFEALGGYAREVRASSVLTGLGLGQVDQTLLVAVLSGGQKTRLGLALLLLREPAFLLLDEPTNHLDVVALEWLEEFVRSYAGAVLVVSHDRAFLDRTVDRILYLDPETRTLKSYVGNYSDFAAARAHEQALHAETWKRQQEYIERVEQDLRRLGSDRLTQERNIPKRQPGVLNLSSKMARVKQARERKLERYLEADERVSKPRQHWQIKLDFGPPPPSSRAVLTLEQVDFAYPGAPTLLSDVDLAVQYGERLALVGPNGAGKTTLLRLIAGQLAPTTGSVRLGPSVRLGVLAQQHETLDAERTVLETVLHERPMTQTEARNFLHYFLFAGDRVFNRVGDCSLGEQSRLQLARLVLRGCNLLLLDEPLNHLDIEGREHFEAALDAFEGTVIAVSHDRRFVHSFAERIVQVEAGTVAVIADHMIG